MKILVVISGLNFIEHPRRSTIVAIKKINPSVDILIYNSLRNIFRKKYLCNEFKYIFFNFWTVGKLGSVTALVKAEIIIKKFMWTSFFKKYEYIFFQDPNQYLLIPYLNNHQKLLYLLRDPSVLQDSVNFERESHIFKRADAILAISENLKDHYFRKYFKEQPSNVFLWPNAVDLNIWNYYLFSPSVSTKKKVAGMAGNINKRTDLNLLEHILINLPELTIEIAGKVNLSKSDEIKQWNRICLKNNFRYLGYITFNDLPQIVANWDVGLLLESVNNEYSIYYNHNKIYQYMALGKPFVSLPYNDYFKKFNNVAFIAQTFIEYPEMIKAALEKSALDITKKSALEYARENSTDKRAQEFLEILSVLK